MSLLSSRDAKSSGNAPELDEAPVAALDTAFAIHDQEAIDRCIQRRLQKRSAPGTHSPLAAAAL